MVVVITNASIQALVAAFVSVRDQNNGDVLDDEDLSYWFQDMLDDRYLDEEALKFVISTPIGRWDVSRVTDMRGLFTDMPFDFDDAEYYHVNDDLTRGDQVDFEDTEYEKFLNTWNVSNVTDMSSMFTDCKNLKRIFSLGHIIMWDTTKLTKTNYMFENCENYFGGVELERFNMENVTDANSMFEGCSGFNSDLSNWNVINLKNANRMFKGCKYFNSDISRWNVRNLKSAKAMFVGCNRFNQDLSSWTFYLGFDRDSLDPNNYMDDPYLSYEHFDGRMGTFMFSSPMREQPEKWPRYVNEPAPALVNASSAPVQRPEPVKGPMCMTQAEYETCEKDEKTKEVTDVLTNDVVERKDAVKLPGTNQCYSRDSLREMVRTYGYRNPINRKPIPKTWLDKQLMEGDCVEAATGGRRRRRKTKKASEQKKRSGSRKGRKAGRRTRNAKKYAKKQNATRRHARRK